MKNVLAVESASSTLSVSLKTQNGIKYQEIIDGFKHSENLAPLIESLLKDSGLTPGELDLLVCSRGPGSFTGLRIGMATLKGISSALNIPLISVPTLDLYAWGKDDFKGVVIPAIDARKKRFYIALYRDGKRETEYLDISPEDILTLIKEEKSILITGIDAPELYKTISSEVVSLDNKYKDNYSNKLIEVGLEYYNQYGPDSPEQGPLYIRKSEAEIELEKRLKKSAE